MAVRSTQSKELWYYRDRFYEFLITGPFLRRYPVHAEKPVDLLLGMTGQPFTAFQVKYAVFIHFPAFLPGDTAQVDIVFLAPGEIKERGPVFFIMHEPDIGLHMAVLHDDADLGQSRRDDGFHKGEMGDPGYDLLPVPVLAGKDDIDIADGFLFPADASGDTGLPHPGNMQDGP